MKLTDDIILNAKPGPKVIKLFDGKGLYLLVTPAGGKGWRLKYRLAGKERLLSMGVYPDVSISEARELCNEARTLLKEGTDPSVARREQKILAEAEIAAAGGVPALRVDMNDAVEIWKGRAVLRLTLDEASFVKNLLVKLIP